MPGRRSVTGLAGLLRTAAIVAALAVPVWGCSPEIGYPAIHDMPAPRVDTPLTPDQIKQATDDLISEREHLSTAAQGAAQPSAGTNAAANPRKKPPPPPALPPPAEPVVQATDPAIVQTSATAAKP